MRKEDYKDMKIAIQNAIAELRGLGYTDKTIKEQVLCLPSHLERKFFGPLPSVVEITLEELEKEGITEKDVKCSFEPNDEIEECYQDFCDTCYDICRERFGNDIVEEESSIEYDSSKGIIRVSCVWYDEDDPTYYAYQEPKEE